MVNEILKLRDEIKYYLDKNSSNKIEIAKRLDYIAEIGCKPYSDVFEYAAKEIQLDRKTVYFYLNVINRFCVKHIGEDFQKSSYKIKPKYEYFNFSQLKAMLGMSEEDIKACCIDDSLSAHEIEKRKKALKRIQNNDDSVSDQNNKEDDPENNSQDDEYFNSDSDIKKNIDIFKDNYIPDNSEFEIVFRNNGLSMVKGRKKQENYNNTLKVLRTLLENNSEDTFYYAVVKIKKPL